LSGVSYGGAQEKVGVVYNGHRWIVKISKKDNGNGTFTHISEYIACHLFNALGVEAQETKIVKYKGETAVAMRDFLEGTEDRLVEFESTGGSGSYSDPEHEIEYSYDGVERDINRNKHMKDKEGAIKHFWLMFVIDALIGNFDRHEANWGFIKNKGEYRVASVYDCGSSLYQRLTERECLIVSNDKEEMRKRIYKYPTSRILINGHKSSYGEIIKSGRYRWCNWAKKYLEERYNDSVVKSIILNCPTLTIGRAEFLLKVIKLRMECLIRGREFDDVYYE
jgi:hypothetical protein